MRPTASSPMPTSGRMSGQQQRCITEGAQLVARWHKQFVRRLGDPTPLSAAEIDKCYAGFETQDFAIGYQAYLDKARPIFVGG